MTMMHWRSAATSSHTHNGKKLRGQELLVHLGEGVHTRRASDVNTFMTRDLAGYTVPDVLRSLNTLEEEHDAEHE